MSCKNLETAKMFNEDTRKDSNAAKSNITSSVSDINDDNDDCMSPQLLELALLISYLS